MAAIRRSDASASMPPPRLTDEAVVERVLGGDVEAYRLLVEKYGPPLVHCAYQILQRRNDAEDVAQEAMVKAFEKLATLREGRFFFTWTWRICTTLALKAHKRQRRMQLGIVGHEGSVTAEVSGLEVDEQRQAVLHALAQLPDEQREVLTLRFWNDMDYDEIGTITGVSRDALYQRACRGLKRLRELLGPEIMEGFGG